MKTYLLKTILFLFFISFNSLFALNTDSLANIVKGSSADTLKLKALEKLVSFYKRKDPAKASDYFNQYESIYKSMKDTSSYVGKFHALKGYRLMHNGEQQNALAEFIIAEKYFLETKSYDELWNVYNNFGSAYENMGNLPKALAYYLKSMDIGEKHLGVGATAGTAMNIGVIYGEQKMYKEALKYFRLSASVYSKVENSWGYGNDLNNIGQVYGFLEQYDSAKYYYAAAIRVWDKMGDKQGLAMTYHNLGNLYGFTKKFGDAEKYLQKSLDLSYEMNDQFGITINLATLSRLALDLGFKEKGLKYMNEAIVYAEKNQLLNVQKENYELLYKFYKKENNYKSAFDYLEKYFVVYDSINNQDNNKVLKEMQEKYESEKKQVEIDKQKYDIAEKDLKLLEQNKKAIIYISIIALALVIILFVLYQYKQKQKSNTIILAQKKEVEKQKELIEIQKEMVEEKNKEITDSINYAKRLQEAILPPEKYFKTHLPDSFIFYRPKDIVAGDFYWMEVSESSNEIFFASADSTGHGVPGALVSVVCSNALNRSVKEFKITSPAKILDKVRELVIETFEKSENTVEDGMDISLCYLDKKSLVARWAGANNPLWIIRNKELIEFKGDKQPIGKYELSEPFTEQKIQLQKGDIIYMFTDGIADQFGGPKGKKFKYKQLAEIILANAHLPLIEQKQKLEIEIKNWQGNIEQVDDMSLIAVQI